MLLRNEPLKGVHRYRVAALFLTTVPLSTPRDVLSVEEDYAVDTSLSPLSSLSRAMTTDGSRRRVKSGWTKARRTVPNWSIRKVPAIGSSHDSVPLNLGRSAHTCLCAPRTASSMVKASSSL